MSSDVLYNHWRGPSHRLTGKGGITFAVVPSIRMTDHFDVGVAICHMKDNFCRRTGRVKALGRTRAQMDGLTSFTIPRTLDMDLNTIGGRKAIITAVRSRIMYHEAQY